MELKRRYVDQNEKFEIIGYIISNETIFKVAQFEKDNNNAQMEILTKILGVEKQNSLELLYYVQQENINDDRLYVDDNDKYKILGTVNFKRNEYKVAQFEKDNEEYQIEIPIRILGAEQRNNSKLLYFVEDDDLIEEIVDLFEDSRYY